MRKPQGYAVVQGPVAIGDRPLGPAAFQGGNGSSWGAQCDTFTCGHCSFLMHVPVRADPADTGGLCKQCMELICPKCVDKRVCTPWEKQLEISEAKHEARRSYGLV